MSFANYGGSQIFALGNDSPIPEPSTDAAILSATTLAFATYRREKNCSLKTPNPAAPTAQGSARSPISSKKFRPAIRDRFDWIQVLPAIVNLPAITARSGSNPGPSAHLCNAIPTCRRAARNDATIHHKSQPHHRRALFWRLISA